MKLSGLTQASVIEAANIIDQQKLTKSQLESNFQALVNDKQYPFKLIVEKAYHIATKEKLPSNTFKEYFYLVKQFESLTGFKVWISPRVQFQKLRTTIWLLNAKDILVARPDGDGLGLKCSPANENDTDLKEDDDFDDADSEDLALEEDNADDQEEASMWEELAIQYIIPGQEFFINDDKYLYSVIQVTKDFVKGGKKAWRSPDNSYSIIPVTILLEFNPPFPHQLALDNSPGQLGPFYMGGAEMKDLFNRIEAYDSGIIPSLVQALAP